MFIYREFYSCNALNVQRKNNNLLIIPLLNPFIITKIGLKIRGSKQKQFWHVRYNVGLRNWNYVN